MGDVYFKRAETDGKCALRVGEHKTIPYLNEGFTLVTKSFVTDENVDFAIKFAYKGKGDPNKLQFKINNSGLTPQNATHKIKGTMCFFV